MDRLVIEPCISLEGKVKVPPSKSHSMRALLFATLAKGTSRVDNLLNSPDVAKMKQACISMGGHFSGAEISGIDGKPKGDWLVDAGNSGIVWRFVGALAGLHSGRLTGDHSIRTNRPIEPLISALNQLGAQAHFDGQHLNIKGPMRAGSLVMDGADSQPVSAMLIAASLLPGITEIVVKNPGEKPWIDVTLHWLKKMGISVEHSNYSSYQIKGGAFPPFQYTVPADFSSAAFPIAAALMTDSKIEVPNLDLHDVQGDKQLLNILIEMGADIRLEETITVCGGRELQGIEIDVGPIIDALPILAVLGCFARGKTHLYNGFIARSKECDRIACIAQELRKMGAQITEHEDGLTIYQSALRAAEVTSHNDQRIALSLICAALIAKGATTITNAHWIEKTYARFPDQIAQLRKK